MQWSILPILMLFIVAFSGCTESDDERSDVTIHQDTPADTKKDAASEAEGSNAPEQQEPEAEPEEAEEEPETEPEPEAEPPAAVSGDDDPVPLPNNETWYLGVDADACDEGDMVLSRTDGQHDCVYGGNDSGLLWSLNHTSDSKSAGFPNGSTVAGTIYVSAFQPIKAVTVWVYADDVEVAKQVFDEPRLFVFAVEDDYAPYNLTTNTTAAIPAGAELVVRVKLTTPGPQLVGYGDEFNSYVVLDAAGAS